MIFITGCNGLVGSFIVRKLVNENIPVKALRREHSDLSLIKDIEGKIEWVTGDISDPVILDGALKGVDTIIHTAAKVSFSPSEKKEMFATNVDGTKTLVNAAINQKVPLFVHVSSIAALGRRKNLSIINEDVFWENSSYNTNYAISKYQSELEVWRGMEEGLRTIIVNPSIVLGPGNWNVGSTKIFKYIWGENLFYPGGDMNFVDVRDVANIVIQLMNSEKAVGNRYILNGGKLPYKEVLGMMAASFGKKQPRFEAGPILSGIAWRAEAVRSFFTGKSPMLTKETAGVSKHSFFYDNSKVKKFLNYQFHTPADTIDWTCNELRKMNAQ